MLPHQILAALIRILDEWLFGFVQYVTCKSHVDAARAHQVIILVCVIHHFRIGLLP
jgi:hypothetical protein